MGPALIEPDHSAMPRRSAGWMWRRNGAGSHRAGSLEVPAPDPQRCLAAMGPALIEPDHYYRECGVLDAYDAPQWGRLSSSRITWGSPAYVTADLQWPQWGRLSSSRITRTVRLCSALRIRPQWGRLSSSRITRQYVRQKPTA